VRGANAKHGRDERRNEKGTAPPSLRDRSQPIATIVRVERALRRMRRERSAIVDYSASYSE